MQWVKGKSNPYMFNGIKNKREASNNQNIWYKKKLTENTTKKYIQKKQLVRNYNILVSKRCIFSINILRDECEICKMFVTTPYF